MKPIFMLMTLSVLAVSAPTFAARPKPPTNLLNGTESMSLATQRTQALQSLQQEMSTKFNEVERRLAAGDYASALSMAKEVLDTVRVKTGIDPKSRLQESFLANTVFPNAATTMQDLSEMQRNLVIKTVADFRGGLFMDIMNLSKRTTLLYIRALQIQMERNGGLTEEDRSKITRDIVRASLIPMPVVDKNNHKIFVFDQDVANEDHTYMFNRELRMYLLQSEQLALTESVFNRQLTNFKQEVLASLAVRPAVTAAASVMSKAYECMSNASMIRYSDDANSAVVKCFNKFYQQTTSMQDCRNLAVKIPYSDPENDALIKCANKFN